jgi:hypothetical protein
MKTLTFTIGFVMLFFAATCSSVNGEQQTEITGTIQEQGITSYQYGTHTLSTENEFYAVKSEAVDLDLYLNEEVTVVVENIPGYPVDGGPEFLLVLKVK